MRAGLIKGVGQARQGDREITECISDRWAMFRVQLSRGFGHVRVGCVAFR